MMVRLGNFLFHFRNYLFPVIIVSLAIIARPDNSFYYEDWEIYRDLLGLLVALIGQGLRFLTIGYDYIKRGGLDRKIYANRLVTGGVFGHCRNPLYVGNFLIVIGVAIIINSTLVYLVGIPISAIAYAAIILAEEDYLRRQFGQEYVDYCTRVNRLWPNLDNFSNSIKEMEFSWKRVVSKEYNTTFAWLLFAFCFEMWEKYYADDNGILTHISDIAPLFIPLILAYIIVKYLKKSGHLRE